MFIEKEDLIAIISNEDELLCMDCFSKVRDEISITNSFTEDDASMSDEKIWICDACEKVIHK